MFGGLSDREERFNVIGTVDGYVLHVTFMMRGQVGRDER